MITKFSKKNYKRDPYNLLFALDLFIADAAEHRNTITEIYNDGISYKKDSLYKKAINNIIENCISDIITKIEQENSINI